MLQLANIQPGEIVVDPMCGGGSIPIEGAIAFNKGFHIGGDYHEKAVFR
jgi:23S rRNA G2445 N2-methylase RlmL